MNLLLATSPHVRHMAVLQSDFRPTPDAMYRFAPIGLLSLMASVRDAGLPIDCDIYDVNGRIIAGAIALDETFYAAVAKDICNRAPDMLGFMTDCDSYHHVLQIAEAVKEARPDCKIVLGGPHASVVAWQTMERCRAIDAIVVGEGEVTFPELLRKIDSSDAAVAGAILRGRTGALLEGKKRELIKCLDDLPLPLFAAYRPDPGEEAFVEVGRGCPFQCRFCSTAPYWQRMHRVKSPGRIVRELRIVRDLYGVRRVHLTHDLFTADRKWASETCEAIASADISLSWTCSARTDTVDSELLAQMADAGCAAIYFGLESGSPRILRQIDKEIPIEKSLAAIKMCTDAGITPTVGFIAGFPNEDASSVAETLACFEQTLRLGCRPARIFALCPFAGAAIYDELRPLNCDGRFVDIPLGEELDARNRAVIMADRDLYGGLFRPRLPALVPDRPEALAAIDEFSPLVEATLVPTLALAARRGGMHAVFLGWLDWILLRNEAREVARWRRAFGTPEDFATFVLEGLRTDAITRDAAVDCARAIRENLRAAVAARPALAISTASHRPSPPPAGEPSRRITLQTLLRRGTVLSTLAFDFDVSEVLLGGLNLPTVTDPTYLAWQRTPEGAVRLLKIDAIVFHALLSLGFGPRTAGDIVFDGIARQGMAGNGDNFFNVIESLEHATRVGLLKTGDIGNE